jgi:uncharacterized protein (UPF0179 family)
VGIFYGLKIISIKFYRLKNTHKLSKSMQKSTLFLFIISLAILSQSCSRQKGYFQQNVAQNYHKVEVKKIIEPIEISKESVIIESEPILTTSTIEDFATTNKVAEEVKYKAKIVKIEQVLAENKTVSKPQKLNFVQKVILKKMQKKVANASKPVDFHDWHPFLKIGAILLGIGLVLAIFGLSVIGGISAFIGLLFTILGLLNSV